MIRSFRSRTVPIPPHRPRRHRTRRDAEGRRRPVARRADRRGDPARIRLKAPLDLPGRHQRASVSARPARHRRAQPGLQVVTSASATTTASRRASSSRNVLENPGWYTPYTPYQAEIAQGRLEGLLNFQTMVSDLTGMEIANASLLDEATAAAEAMTMLHRVQAKRIEAPAARRSSSSPISCFPQTIERAASRAEPLGIELVVGDRMDGVDVRRPRVRRARADARRSRPRARPARVHRAREAGGRARRRRDRIC